ncbi:protein mono-ADP-ribosyltransferase PARP14-like [Callorhinchus milii]|uniref:protein mono-ADP-ribosyltransferase PARP14-like n=1 Tax=Callorhinchus milii TaxID=7868 RepID=UPI001C3FD0C3|nr:protein mono-ADP-ribosyltransferase PARP14-like [Callorhinchus milii]
MCIRNKTRNITQPFERVTAFVPAMLLHPAAQTPGITVMLKKGDITKESTDATLNKTLDFTVSVPGEILEAAGSQPDDGGQLQRSNIVHAVKHKTAALITASVEKIDRIQNRKLWRSYSVRKQTVDRKYPNVVNEQILYRGITG